jgi:hypothetical protein
MNVEEELDYWKTRCKLAEEYIRNTPCDYDINKEQQTAYEAWQEFKNLPIQ